MNLKPLFSEKFFILIITAISFILNFSPFAYQNLINPSEKVYIGSFPVLVDKAVYLAEITQGKEGGWKMTDKYTTEPQKPVFLYPLYLELGHIAGITDISVENIFLISRFFFGIILLGVVLCFIRYFMSDETQRKLAYFFAFFSSGLGWLTTNKPSIDLWIPDAIPMVRFSYFPHLMLANILSLIIILLIYQAFKKENSKKLFIISGILSFLLNIILPFTSILLYFLILALIIILLIKNISSIKNNLINILIFFSISLPSLFFMYYIGTTDPIWSMVEKQNILPTPSPLYVLTGYGLILIFSLYGLLALYRKDQIKGLFFTVWTLSVPLLAYIPLWIYPMQRRFLETGFYVPLAITASFGIKGIYEYLKNRKTEYLKLKFISIFAMFIFPFMFAGNLQNWFQFKYMANKTENPKIYLPKKNIEAMEWLSEKSSLDSIILSSFYNGNVIPYYTNRTVYVGHGPATIDLEKKNIKTENFYSGKLSPEEMLEFLRKEKIDYVFYSDEERKLGNLNPKNYDFLKETYKNDTVKIYKFINK